MSDSYAVTVAHWGEPQEREDSAFVRRAVFIEEQQVPEELEWDGLDEEAFHLLARDAAGHPVGSARMLADGHIGRMAVLRNHRGRGIGTALLRRMIDEGAHRGLQQVWLDAQLHAIPFYERLGFAAEGEPFMDAGIAHRRMVRPVDETGP